MHMLKMIALATLAACAFAIPVTKDDHHRMLQAGDNEDYSFLRHMQPVDPAVDDPRAP